MQEYTSKDTSLNQIPALHKALPWPGPTRNLDYGGGKYDAATNYLASKGVENLVYDPFNRSQEHNKEVMRQVSERPPAFCTCANVLNVIQEDSVVLDVLRDIRQTGIGQVFISTYEGNRTGKGKATSKGYQRNMKTRDYLPLVKQVFPMSRITKGFIWAINDATFN